jgi:hypothetical protein
MIDRCRQDCGLATPALAGIRLLDEPKYRHHGTHRMNPHLADLSDHRQWADRNASRAQLPLLLRRLILATSGADLLRAPAGDAVGEYGWASNSTCRAVCHRSCLQASRAGKGVRARQAANEGAERLQEAHRPGARCPASQPNVRVLHAHFEDSEDWLADKADENHGWKAIKVIDGVILEEWLESQPAVHIWFSELIGKVPTEVGALSTWWERWSAEAEPAMPAGVITAGRAEQAAELRAALRAPHGRSLSSLRRRTRRWRSSLHHCKTNR